MGDVIAKMKRVLFICALLFAAALCEDKPPAGDEAADAADDMSGDPKVDGKKEMAEMDTNKDGKATLEEIEAFMKARYYTKAEDLKNDEGKPATPEDVKKMITRDASELLKELDKDKSNDLNEAEVIAQYEDTGDIPDDEAADEDGDAAAEEADGEAMPEDAEEKK